MAMIIEEQKFYVWDEVFAIVKTKEAITGAFAMVQDKNEVTVILDESKIDENKSKIIEAEKGYKIITFDMVLPFGMVGFLAKISQALAEEKISIFAISAFSTDHILVKENDLPKAARKLETIGFCKK